MTKSRWLFNSLLALILTFSLLMGATDTALAEFAPTLMSSVGWHDFPV